MQSELLPGEGQCQVNPLGGQGFKGFVVFQLPRHQGQQCLRDKLGGAFTLMHITQLIIGAMLLGVEGVLTAAARTTAYGELLI